MPVLPESGMAKWEGTGFYMGEIILLQSSLWLEAVTVEQKVSVTQGGEGMPTDTAGSQPHHGEQLKVLVWKVM